MTSECLSVVLLGFYSPNIEPLFAGNTVWGQVFCIITRSLQETHMTFVDKLGLKDNNINAALYSVLKKLQCGLAHCHWPVVYRPSAYSVLS